MSRIFLFFTLLACLFAGLFLILDWILGHRLLIPLARLLKFKSNDVKKTNKKVKEILGEDDDWEKKKDRTKKRRARKK